MVLKHFNCNELFGTFHCEIVALLGVKFNEFLNLSWIWQWYRGRHYGVSQ
jgi:hypothetical protein